MLVVILAQTRAHALTWDNLKAHLLDNLCPCQPENVDLALCIAKEANTSTNPFHARAKFVWTYAEVSDWGEAYDDAQRQLGCDADWRLLMRVRDQWLGGIKDSTFEQRGSAAILIFFRWLLIKNLQEQGLFASYDRIVVTRSDYYHRMLHPPLAVLPSDRIWIPDGEKYHGVTDRHIIVPTNLAAEALDMLTDMLCNSEALYANMSAFRNPNWNLEQFIKYHLIRKGLFPRVSFFPYVMYTVRLPSDDTRWKAQGEYIPEAGMIVKYGSEFTEYKRFAGTIHSNYDWDNYMASRPPAPPAPPLITRP